MAKEPTPELEKMVSGDELAAMLGVNKATVTALRRSGRIVGYRLLRHFRYDPEAVKKALAEP